MISNIITFTSDFGTQDEWVAEVKGVILSINYHAEIYDLTHNIPSYDIRKGALILRSAIPYFPMGTHLAVVDPGVGTERKALIIKAERGDIFVGPDNGLLIEAAEKLGGLQQVVNITNSKYFLKPVCPTFQARDIFAPVVAHLSRGESLLAFGEEIATDNLVRLEPAKKDISEKEIETEVLDIDSFGTVRMNISRNDLKKAGLGQYQDFVISIKKKKLNIPLKKTFSQVKAGESVLVFDSSGYLSISVNQGRAAEIHGLKVGDEITIRAGKS